MMRWLKWLRRLVWGARVACPHCGEVGWGNEIGCNRQWQEWAVCPSDFDESEFEDTE